jgi:hypothetical protein
MNAESLLVAKHAAVPRVMKSSPRVNVRDRSYVPSQRITVPSSRQDQT